MGIIRLIKDRALIRIIPDRIGLRLAGLNPPPNPAVIFSWLFISFFYTGRLLSGRLLPLTEALLFPMVYAPLGSSDHFCIHNRQATQGIPQHQVDLRSGYRKSGNLSQRRRLT